MILEGWAAFNCISKPLGQSWTRWPPWKLLQDTTSLLKKKTESPNVGPNPASLQRYLTTTQIFSFCSFLTSAVKFIRSNPQNLLKQPFFPWSWFIDCEQMSEHKLLCWHIPRWGWFTWLSGFTSVWLQHFTILISFQKSYQVPTCKRPTPVQAVWAGTSKDWIVTLK